MGPAFSFDTKARFAMSAIINAGYTNGVLAGNTLATHDLEESYFHTALGQDIYTQKNNKLGQYNHLYIYNKVRKEGPIKNFIDQGNGDNGIIYYCVKNNVPIVLASSIRDDELLLEVIANTYEAQLAMREKVKNTTTIICLATMLHTIATGNMSPSFRNYKR